MQLTANDANFDFIMCTNYKKLFCFFHYRSSFAVVAVFVPSDTHRTLNACSVIFFATFSVVDGLLHFTIISRAKKKNKNRHETTAPHNDILYPVLSLSHSSPWSLLSCVVAQFLHYRLSAVLAQFTQSHTNSHTNIHSEHT